MAALTNKVEGLSELGGPFPDVTGLWRVTPRTVYSVTATWCGMKDKIVASWLQINSLHDLHGSQFWGSRNGYCDDGIPVCMFWTIGKFGCCTENDGQITPGLHTDCIFGYIRAMGIADE
jgi:hypothetical protein